MQIKDMISFRLLHKQIYPDGFAVDYTYTGKGYLEEIKTMPTTKTFSKHIPTIFSGSPQNAAMSTAPLPNTNTITWAC